MKKELLYLVACLALVFPSEGLAETKSQSFRVSCEIVHPMELITAKDQPTDVQSNLKNEFRVTEDFRMSSMGPVKMYSLTAL